MACPPPDTYCTATECEEPSRQGRAHCPLHEKRLQRCECPSPARCTCLAAPRQERLSPKGRLVEAALRLAECDAEDDTEYQRLERALFLAARQFSPAAPGESVRQGMDSARRRGVHVGRPRVMTPALALTLVARTGSVTLAAKAGSVSASTVRRALRRGAKGGLLLGPVAGDVRAVRRRSSSAR
jgi:hypothetical protein